jgi:hypothetical protein
MGKNFRIRTKVGVDTRVEAKLEQDFDFLEILSLKLTQQQVYNRPTSNYGVLCGRVYANNGFGVPNAKVSVFIPLTDEDSNNPVISRIYPYRNLNTQNEDGYRYNLLPYVASYTGHVPTGTFPDREDILKDKSLSYTYEKYYKFTAKTNDAGDFMIFGAPVGNHTIVMDVDVSDIGQFSLTPQDLLRIGRATEAQLDGAKFKESTDLDSLPQIIGIKKTIDINPFWGDPDLATIAVTRVDFNLLEEANIEFKPTCVFMGSLISGIDTKAISKTCKVKVRAGDLCELVTGPGQILAIRQTVNFDNLGRPILEQYKVENDGQVIDENGTWMIDLPMNMDYVYTDEEGKQQISYDPSIGIPTKGRYRFKIKWNQSDKSTEQLKRGYFLIPNVKEYGWDKDNLNLNPAKDLNPPPTVPPTISAATISTPSVTGPPVISYQIDQPLVDFANTPFGKFTRSYSFSLSWFDYVNPQSAINCDDTFYEFQYNKVYTVSQLIDKYRSGKLPARFLGFKNCLDDKCAGSTEKFPVNDGHYNITFLYVLLTALITLAKPIVLIIVLIFAILARIYRILVDFICDKIIPLLRDLGRTRTIASVDFVICPRCNDTANDLEAKWCDKPNPFTDKRFPLLLQDDGDCSFCDCKDSGESLAGSVYGATNSSCLADISATSKWLYDVNISTDLQSPPQINLLAGFTSPFFNFATRMPTTCVYPSTYSYGSLAFDYGSIFLLEQNSGPAVFSPSLTIAERLSLFNTKAKYFDNGGLESNTFTLPTNSGANIPSTQLTSANTYRGGWNRVKISISSTPAKQDQVTWNIPQKAEPTVGSFPPNTEGNFHLDNVMILLVDEACKLGTTQAGTLVTFNNPILSSDKNLTGHSVTSSGPGGSTIYTYTTNPYGGRQILVDRIHVSAQTSVTSGKNLDVWYADPYGDGEINLYPEFNIFNNVVRWSQSNDPFVVSLQNAINANSATFGTYNVANIRGESDSQYVSTSDPVSFPYVGKKASYTINYDVDYIPPYYKYPADLEYFQVIENWSVELFLSKCAPNDANNVMSLKRRYLMNEMQVIRWRKFKYVINSGSNGGTVGNAVNTNNTNLWMQPTVYSNQLKPHELFQNFNKLRIVILQRGVDPYSPKFNMKIDISRLLGFTDFRTTFSSTSDSRVIQNWYRLNQPIQGSQRNASHYYYLNKKTFNFEGTMQLDSGFPLFDYSRLFFKSKFFKPNTTQFQQFSSTVLQKYSALGDRKLFYPSPNGSNVNGGKTPFKNWTSFYKYLTFCNAGLTLGNIYYGGSGANTVPSTTVPLFSSGGRGPLTTTTIPTSSRYTQGVNQRILLYRCTIDDPTITNNAPGFQLDYVDDLSVDGNNTYNQFYFSPIPVNSPDTDTNLAVSVLNNNSSLNQDGITTSYLVYTRLENKIKYGSPSIYYGALANENNLYTQRWKKTSTQNFVNTANASDTFYGSFIGVNKYVNPTAWGIGWQISPGSSDNQQINTIQEYPGYTGYFPRETLEGGSYMWAELDTQNNNTGTAADPDYGYKLLKQIYYVPRYTTDLTINYSLLTGAAIPTDNTGLNNTTNSNDWPNQQNDDYFSILRSDRLPTSDNLDTEGRNSFVFYQNNEFAVYIIDTTQTGITVSFSQSAQNNSGLALENETVSADGGGEFPLQNVLATISDCTLSKNLGCYSINTNGDVTVSSLPGCSQVPKDSQNDLTKVSFFENGCYILVRTDEDFIYSFQSDAKIVQELFLRIKYNLAICLNVISHNFNNEWINGTLLAFPFKQVTIFGGNNQVSQRNFCKETMMFNYQSNNFYYRSSPYALGGNQYTLNTDGTVSNTNETGTNAGQFVGQRKNYRNTGNIFGATNASLGNNRQLLFPTTILDMGPVNPNIQEYVYSDDYDGYMLNNLNSTTFQNTSDIINFFTLTRLLRQGLSLNRFTNQDGAFVPDVVIDSLFDARGPEKAVDGDFAQSIAINSQLGIINFTPENYTSDTVKVFTRSTGTGNDTIYYPTFGIFFSGSTSQRDLVSPRRIIYIENSNIPLNTDYYLNILTKSQEVPFYHWNLDDSKNYKPGSYASPSTAGPNIFGSESNNWLTGPDSDSIVNTTNFNQNNQTSSNNNKFFKYKYQKVDRLDSVSDTFQNYNTSQTRLTGWIWDYDATTNKLNYQITSSKGSRHPRIMNGAPYYFYFGLIKGATAWDRFVRRWINTTEEL